jgi:hypothetical protein
MMALRIDAVISASSARERNESMHRFRNAWGANGGSYAPQIGRSERLQ